MYFNGVPFVFLFDFSNNVYDASAMSRTTPNVRAPRIAQPLDRLLSDSFVVDVALSTGTPNVYGRTLAASEVGGVYDEYRIRLDRMAPVDFTLVGDS